ncbi:hypothetical protein ACO0OL_000754 [Hanseniaspora opuntiae]|jgi:general transcription factor 3C polypeptide 5 (transcription factor C subunit 1)
MSRKYPNAETFFIRNKRYAEVKTHSLQDSPTVTSIEFPLQFNPKHNERTNIEKLIYKCGGNQVVSQYIDDLEEKQKIEEFQLEKKRLLAKKKVDTDSKNVFETGQVEDEDEEIDEEEDEEEDEDMDVDEEEEDDDSKPKPKGARKRRRKAKDLLTKLHLQPGIGDDALLLYLNKTQDKMNAFFNEKPILGRPNRDQKIVLKIKIKKDTLPPGSENMSLIEKLFTKNVTYETEPVAVIDSTIKFRITSDAQFALDHNKTAQDFKNSMLDLNFEDIDSFIENLKDMDNEPWMPVNTETNSYELMPPIKTFIAEMPFEYEFKGNKLASKIATSTSVYVPTYQVQVSSFEKIPDQPSVELQEKWRLAKEVKRYPHFLSIQTAYDFFKDLEEMIELIKAKFEERPIWLKKHLQGVIIDKPSLCGTTLKYALPFVAYRIMKGPWIHSYCKYGVDPTSDPKYHLYQVEQFRMTTSPNTEIFKDYEPCPKEYTSNVPGDIDSRFYLTGKSIPWYSTYTMEVLMTEENVCDIIQNSQLLEKCDPEHGWFNELDTWKRKRLVKYILDCLYQGITEFSEDKIKIYKNMPSIKLFAQESSNIAKKRDLMALKNSSYAVDENIDDINDDEFDEKLIGNLNLEECTFDDVVNRIMLQNPELANETKEFYSEFIKN